MSSILKFLDTAPTIEEVERKIQSLHDDIRTLKQYRNARLLIVSRLPPEVLSIIFEYIAVPQLPLPEMKFPRPRPNQARLSASHVCKLWRNIALQSPRMWWCIFGESTVDLTELLLKRTKSAPLYLISCNTYLNTATVKRLLQDPGRLKEIDLVHCNIQSFDLIAEMKTSSLESLSIAGSPPRASKARLEPAVEPGTVPPLRHLYLQYYIFDLDIPFFSHLRTLKLCYEEPQSGHTLSVTQILTALRNMEYLEQLELVNVIGGSERNVSEDLWIHHPRLTSIRAVVTEMHGLLLFTRLSCPNIQSIIVQGNKKAEHNFLAHIASGFYGMIPASSNPWKVRAYSAPSFSQCRATIHIWPDSSKDTDAPFQISVCGPPNFRIDLALFSLLPSTTPYIFAFEHSCHSVSDEQLDFDGLYGFLQSLESVQELHCSSLAGIVTILSDTPPVPDWGESSITRFSLPSLKRIVLTQAGRIIYRKRKLKKLEQMLAARRAVGAGIETFEIPRCLTEDEAARLKPLVGTFVVARS